MMLQQLLLQAESIKTRCAFDADESRNGWERGTNQTPASLETLATPHVSS
jgi:hypothetical protein